nr:hypothetical protein [Spirulina subsalsa]
MFRLKKFLAPLLLSLLLLITACDSAPPSDFQQAQQESTQRGARAVDREAVAGGEFNKFFPRSQAGYEVVYAQEKKGFAEAKLKREGRDVAMLAVSDTVSNPEAAQKFANSTEQIQGYPVVAQGNTATALLVADRFQVKVLSRDPEFTEGDRKTWLGKFDLSGLARLK